MNARVFLVVLLTATFMAVWDADQKAMNAALAQKQRSAGQPSQVVVKRQQSGVNTPDARSPKLPDAKEHVELMGSFIPVPRGLANGPWKAIAESGEIYSITIDRAFTKGPGCFGDNSLENNFTIIIGEKGDRWCFVRSRVGIFSEPRSASAEANVSVK